MQTELSATYSINDLENFSGIKAHTIRIWEKRYGVVTPGRTETNIRYYSNDDLKKILNIKLLNQHGYKISDISSMSDRELSAKVDSIALVNSDSREEMLLSSIIEMSEPLFNKAFANVVIELGLEAAIVSVVFPFFKRIGIIWQSGSINPAQEHFFSNLIRGKIISATDQISTVPALDAPTAILFLPEGELHEIGLLFYNYALRKRGYKTIYLGQSVPYESLNRIYRITPPSIVITSMTNPALPESFLSICGKVCRQAGHACVYFTGSLPYRPESNLPSNARFTNDLRELLKL